MQLSKRVEDLEGKMETHLTESGEIRADIRWLKRTLWGLLAIDGSLLIAAVTAMFEVFFKAGH